MLLLPYRLPNHDASTVSGALLRAACDDATTRHTRNALFIYPVNLTEPFLSQTLPPRTEAVMLVYGKCALRRFIDSSAAFPLH